MHKSHKARPLDLDFRHLRTFLTLARLGNFSQTGREVTLSQSAVSRHIRALEETLGLRLFQRLGRRAILTSAGHTLRTRLATLMREVESVPRVICFGRLNEVHASVRPPPAVRLPLVS